MPGLSVRIRMFRQRTWYGPVPDLMLCTCNPIKPLVSRIQRCIAHHLELEEEFGIG
jgi:hypothetical protein